MVELTPEAQSALDEYLRLADDLFRERLMHELRSVPRPVSGPDLEAALLRIGEPSRLVPYGGKSWWERAASRWPIASVLWWLACLSLGLLIVGTALAGPFGILASFLVSRAALAVADDKEDLGPRKWLLFPALILVYAPLAGLLFWWPLLPPIMLANLSKHLPLWGPEALLLFVLPLWWLVLARVARRFPRFLPSLFRPFCRPGACLSVGMALLSLLFFLLSVWPFFVVYKPGPTTAMVPARSGQGTGATQ